MIVDVSSSDSKKTIDSIQLIHYLHIILLPDGFTDKTTHFEIKNTVFKEQSAYFNRIWGNITE
jgi:hypothetical protein